MLGAKVQGEREGASVQEMVTRREMLWCAVATAMMAPVVALVMPPDLIIPLTLAAVIIAVAGLVVVIAINRGAPRASWARRRRRDQRRHPARGGATSDHPP